jgi:hypothetical protein
MSQIDLAVKATYEIARQQQPGLTIGQHIDDLLQLGTVAYLDAQLARRNGRKPLDWSDCHQLRSAR